MATDVDQDDGRLRDIHLVQNPDGHWTARDVTLELAAQGCSREEALRALDDIVEVVHEDGGHVPTDEELRELGVDPDIARTQDEELPDVLR